MLKAVLFNGSFSLYFHHHHLKLVLVWVSSHFVQQFVDVLAAEIFRESLTSKYFPPSFLMIIFLIIFFILNQREKVVNVLSLHETTSSPVNLLSSVNDEFQLSEKLSNCRHFVFIHIGKNGGSTVGAFLDSKYGSMLSSGSEVPSQHGNIVENKYIEGNIKPNTCFLSSVRDPVERWVSAYLSQYRSGCPAWCSSRVYNGAKELYKTFPSPNHLAEALYSNNNKTREKARALLVSNRHLTQDTSHYFRDFKDHRNETIYIGLTCDMKNTLYNIGLIISAAKRNIYSEDFVQMAVNKFMNDESGHKHANADSLKVMEYLSPLGYKNVKKYMAHEYMKLQELADYGLLASADINAECLKLGKSIMTENSKYTREDWEIFVKNNPNLRKQVYLEGLQRKQEIFKGKREAAVEQVRKFEASEKLKGDEIQRIEELHNTG